MTLLPDLRQAARSLWRAPVFTLLASTTLALGIGAAVAAFAYLGYLTRPTLEAPRSEQLRFVYQATPDDPRGGFSTPELRDLEAAGALRPLAAWRLFSASLSWPDATRHAWGHAVSGDYFTLFGTRPALGRLLGPEDDRDGAPPVLVLGHRFWQRRLGGDPGVVGRSVVLDGTHRYTVVGVAAARFQGEGFGTAVYLPLASAPWLLGLADREAPALTLLGRLEATGAALPAARLAAVARHLDAMHPRQRPRRFELVPPQQALAWSPDDPTVRGAEVLSLAVAALLLLGAVNVATLMLARASARRREAATRSALGASPARLVRVALGESLLVAGLGLALGLPLAALLLRVVEGYLIGTSAVGLGDWSDASHLPIDGPATAALGVGLALASAALCGLASVAPQLREDLVPALKADGEAPGSTRSLRLGGRRALVVAQAALSMALLVVAALASRSLGHLGAQTLGFPTAGRLLAVVHAPPQAADVHEALLRSVRELPGVRAAGLVVRGPLHAMPGRGEVEGGARRVAVIHNAIGDGYLEALGVPLLAGRDIAPTDDREAPRVALVSRQLGQALWPDAPALGRRLRLHEPGRPPLEAEVVGVAADSRQGPLVGEIPPHVFLARRQRPGPRPTLVIHATAAIAEPLARLLRERHPAAALIDLQPLAEQRRRSLADGRMNAELAAGLGLLGTTLSAVGLFGLLSFNVARRSREFGVRLALGARGADLRRGVLADAARLTGVGLVAGLGLALPLARLAQSRLAGISASDPATYAAAAAVLFATGLAAAWGPARRAARSEPLAALRRS